MEFSNRNINVRKNDISNLLYQINILLCMGIAVTTIFNVSSLTTIFFYSSFFVTFIIFFFSIQKEVKNDTMRRILIVLIILFSCGLISIFPIYSSSRPSVNYFKKYIIYITTLISYFVSVSMIPTKKTVFLLLFCNFILALLYIIRSRGSGAYVANNLWLYFSNPNFAGMWLFMTVALLVITFFFVEKLFIKFIVIAVAMYCGYLCYRTGSRNVLMSLVFLVVLTLFCIISKNKKFSKAMLLIICIFPLAFAFIYISIINTDYFSNWLASILTLSGKRISSRYLIWKEAFYYIEQSPIIGGYGFIQGGNGSFQLHNTHLDVFAAYGIIGFLLFFIYLVKIVFLSNWRSNNMKSMVSLMGFLTMILLGTSEASLYSTGMGMYIFVSSFLMLSNYFSLKKGVISCD